jgi:SAM-dependent methyltransferase
LTVTGGDSDISSMNYIECVNRIAEDDLAKPSEPHKIRQRVKPFTRFIGKVDGTLVDVGCGEGELLELVDAGERFGFDIAQPFIQVALMKGLDIFYHDAQEPFPIQANAFTMSEVLEHVLDPVQVVNNAWDALLPHGRLFVMVPWEEDLRHYDQYKGVYEFTHLRRFRWGPHGVTYEEKGRLVNGLFAKKFILIRSRRNYPDPDSGGQWRRYLAYHIPWVVFPWRVWEWVAFNVLGYKPVNMMMEFRKV